MGFDLQLLGSERCVQGKLEGLSPQQVNKLKEAFTRMFEPTSRVSGLSVLSLKVMQGTPRMQVSSCTTAPKQILTTLGTLPVIGLNHST